MQSSLLTRRYIITGSQRLSNYFLAFLISFGGAGFLITGFTSFLNRDINGRSSLGEDLPSSLPLWGTGNNLLSSLSENLLVRSKSIEFFPQGLIMCFYGALGLIFGIYLCLTIFWKVGSGFNEFNKNTGVVRIFRWGLPGKERRIDFRYKINDIESLRVSLKEGVNPRRTIALQIKGKAFTTQNSFLESKAKASLVREIPLTRIGQPIALQDIESEASLLAQFLQTSLETFYKM